MKIMAIDPGNVESAWVYYDSDAGKVLAHMKEPNAATLVSIKAANAHALVIEQIACMGMAVGAEVFETVFWSGRFAQAWQNDAYRAEFHRIKRGQVKMHLCNNMRAKDGNIRQAIIDRFGGSSAIGKKKSPGPLYGIAGDEWAALAVALTFADTHAEKLDTQAAAAAKE